MLFASLLTLIWPVSQPVYAETFTTANPTEHGGIDTNSARGATCPTASFTKTALTILSLEVWSSDTNNGCQHIYAEYALTIPDDATITGVTWSFEINSVTDACNND